MKLFKSLPSALEAINEVEALKLDLKTEKFPPELFFFPNLKELYLEGSCTELPKLGNPWPKLKVLSIKWPDFKGDLAALFSLPSLENLKILETPQKRLLLPLGVAGAPIKSLTIKGCVLEILPEEISMLTQLSELNLTKNDLSKLPRSFPTLSMLKRCNLDQNKFSKFPDLIREMSGLSHLSIDGNDFSEDEKARIQREFHIWPN